MTINISFANHSAYSLCTLYLDESGKGLSIIQQYIDDNKCTYWSKVNTNLAENILNNPDFNLLFNKYASYAINDIYPTISVRHAMHWLKMKPMKKEPWETVFDRVLI